MVVVVDNVSEFKETYERYLGDLMALIRDGRSFGVYFVITASLTADVPNKLFSLLSQRITFTLPDPADYTTIVGPRLGAASTTCPAAAWRCSWSATGPCRWSSRRPCRWRRRPRPAAPAGDAFRELAAAHGGGLANAGKPPTRP